MPKSLTEFSVADWRRLRPLTQAVKTARYNLIDRTYRRRPAAAGDAAAVAQSVRGRKLLVTIAFGDPKLALWQTCLLRHYVSDALHLVVDNSVTDEIAHEICRVAVGAGTAYLRVPPNPWSGHAASRSHGIALNWTWQNVIRAGEPEAFGFIDHDIFPTAADDPFTPLAVQDFYGIVREAGPRWFLWAGFCMFRFAAVKDKALDFGQDWFIGLDTGGGNWRPLYSQTDRATLREPPTTLFPFKPGIALADGPLQWCGSWLHEVGLMGDRRLVAEKRAMLAAMLTPHLEAAAGAAAVSRTQNLALARRDRVELRARGTSPKILEIGAVPFMRQAFPNTTEFYSSWHGETTNAPKQGRHVVSLAALPRLARRLADQTFDLVVVHAPPFRPWGGRALVRAFFRRGVLSGNLPAFRGFGAELLRFPVAAPIVILDLEDATTIARSNLFLLDKAVLYFKRELPIDHWKVFAGTAHWRVPTPRFRAEHRNRERIGKLRPISLGLPFEVSRRDFSVPDGEKTIDVFFAGRIRDSSTARERGFAELLALRQRGYAIDASDAALPLEEYLARCRRAYLVWSPEGFGWQCFRTYEAAISGAAPLCSRPGIERYRPLIEGVHAIYYDVEPGELTRTVTAALADRERLRAIGAVAREHVRAFHTHTAIAQHIVDAAAEIVGRSAVSAADRGCP